MRRRHVLPLTVALVACGAGGGAERPRSSAPSSTAHAPLLGAARAFSVVYREAANAFEILDNVSGWFPEKNDAEYREYWRARFGISSEDEAYLRAWAEVRKRAWSPEPEGSTVLLGRTKPPDRLAAIFHREADLEVAIARAAELVGPTDGATVRSTFEAFRPKLDALLGESRAFEAIAPKLQARLDDRRAATFVARVARFYRTGALPTFTVALVWWPPVDHTSASVAGDVLLIRYHPAKHREDAEHDVDVPIHEFVHFASSHQPETQKVALSRAFAAKCELPSRIPPARVLEEPLAVAHQKMFLSEVDPERFDRARSWYGDPWVSALAKLIFDPVRVAYAEGRALDERLALDAGRSCRELVAVGKELSR